MTFVNNSLKNKGSKSPSTGGEKSLPDVSADSQASTYRCLDRVGMAKIEMPILWEVGVERYKIPAKVDAFVSLDQPEAKGIHMSRIYLHLKKVLETEVLSLRTMKNLLQEFVMSQRGLSKNSEVRIEFEMPVERKALISDQKGWRHYPVVLEGQMTDGALAFQLSTRITYSSTCPCSGALARQLIVDEFDKDFSEQNILNKETVADWLKEKGLFATPHAQRSFADVKVELDPESIAPEPIDIIDWVEAALATPVQSAVKREDEQEFARLNGQNMMFCEDAARRICDSLDAQSRVVDYVVRVDHRESLHPHNAVSVVTKGIEEGFKAQDI